MVSAAPVSGSLVGAVLGAGVADAVADGLAVADGVGVADGAAAHPFTDASARKSSFTTR